MGLNNAQIAMLCLTALALLVVYFGVIRSGSDDNNKK